MVLLLSLVTVLLTVHATNGRSSRGPTIRPWFRNARHAPAEPYNGVAALHTSLATISPC
jgi:hypothetical protein